MTISRRGACPLPGCPDNYADVSAERRALVALAGALMALVAVNLAFWGRGYNAAQVVLIFAVLGVETVSAWRYVYLRHCRAKRRTAFHAAASLEPFGAGFRIGYMLPRRGGKSCFTPEELTALTQKGKDHD